MPSARTYRIIRLSLLAAVLLVATILGAGEWFSHHYRRVIQERLPALSAKATDSLYHITIEGLNINIFSRTITITGLRMTPDGGVIARRTAAGCPPGKVYDLYIPEVEIHGLKWRALEKEKDLGCRRIILYRPKADVYLSTDSVKDTARQAPQLKRIFARHILIRDPQVRVYRDRAAPQLLFESKGGRIAADDWELVPGRPADTARFFHAGEASVCLTQLRFGIPGTLYAVQLDSVGFGTDTRNLKLQGLQIHPTVDEEELYRQAGMQREIYNADFRLIDIRNLWWNALLQRGDFIAADMTIGGGNVDVYYSRVPPPSTVNKVGHYPHQLLQGLPTALVLPLVRLNHCSVRYTELNNKTRQPATITFTQARGQITNITNRAADIARNPYCLLQLQARFMDRSPIAVTFNFLLSSRKGAFSLAAVMRDLDGALLREPARALTLAEIKRLQLHELEFQITGDEDTSNGRFRILYDDLKVKLLRLDTATMRMRNRPLLTFAVNNLLLYNDNPMAGDTVRLAYTHVARDPLKPFFNLIWKNLFNGFVQTAVRTEGLTDIVRRQQANKGKPKRKFFKGLFPKRQKNGR